MPKSASNQNSKITRHQSPRFGTPATCHSPAEPFTFAWQGDALCEKEKIRSDEAARILGPWNHFTWGPETVNINNPDKTLSSSGPPWIITGPHPLLTPIREAPCIKQVRDVSNNKTYSLRIYIIGSTWMIFSVYGHWQRLVPFCPICGLLLVLILSFYMPLNMFYIIDVDDDCFKQEFSTTQENPFEHDFVSPK